MKFNVPDMRCGHCTSTIEKAIKGVDSAATVTFDIAAHTVVVNSGLPPKKLAEVLKQAGYPSTPAAT